MAFLMGCEGAHLEFPAKLVLDDVTLGVHEGDRIGIVGKNGDGKSTLLGVLAGQIELEGGLVRRTRGLTVGVLGQTDSLSDDATVGYSVVGDAPEYEWASDPRIREIISELIADIDWNAKVGTLSGGQRRRVDLTRLLIGDYDVIMMDEPTNHLDIRAIAWLARHLNSRWQRNSGALLCVTHDRWFLDEVCTGMWEVHDGKVEPFEGGYSAYVLQRVERERIERVTEERRQNLMRKELAWLSRGARARSTKPKFHVALAEELIAGEPPVRNTLELRAMAMQRLGKQVVEFTNVTEKFDDKTVLDHIDWHVGPGDRYGILGENGAGKTTLLSVLDGSLRPSSGFVKIGKTVKFAVLSQRLDELNELGKYRVTEVLSRHKSRIVVDGKETTPAKLLERLGFSSKHLYTRIDDLSGGQKRRLQLLLILLEEPNVLILDEPGNDLDTDMLAVLEDLLDTWAGTLVMVTHDRYFLERVVNHITELSRGKLYHYEANYSRYLELREQRAQMAEASERKRQSILRVEREWILRGCQARSTKSKERIDRYEALKNQKAPERDSTVQLAAASSRLGKKIITLEHVSKGYDGRTLFADFSYGVLRTDRIGIVGRNGAGKSTLLRLLAGEIQPDSGTVELGETVRIGHFSQEGRELDLNQRVYDCIHEVAAQVKTDEGTFSAKTMLERFLFTPDLQQTTIGRLSGGERRRLYLLSVLMAAPNVLLLDEPTNDLDVTTLSILEDYLQSFTGPIITVSHDRFFLDKMADTILEVRPEGRVDIFTGNWSDWARKRRPAEEKKPEKSEKTEKPQPERPREKKLKFSYNEQREFETIDAVLAELEEKLAACRRAQEACGSDYVRLQELTDEQERLSAELDEKTERWVYLNDLKEKIDAQNSQG